MGKILFVPKLIAGIVITFLAGAVVTILFSSNANKNLTNNLNTEKLNSERLLAEKLSLNKEIAHYNKKIDQFKLDMNNLKGKNNELDVLLADLQNKLSQKQAELNRLTKANAGKKAIEKELQELKVMKDNYEGQVTALNNEVKTLASDNSALTENNNLLNQEITALETQNNELVENNQLLKIMATEDYVIEGLEEKEDETTLIAKRTDKLVMSFEVPGNINPDLKFNIIAPDGKKVDESDINISITTPGPGENDQAVGISESGIKLNKKIRMEYDPNGKFSSGIYKTEVFNYDNYMGSCQVRLK